MADLAPIGSKLQIILDDINHIHCVWSRQLPGRDSGDMSVVDGDSVYIVAGYVSDVLPDEVYSGAEGTRVTGRFVKARIGL